MRAPKPSLKKASTSSSTAATTRSSRRRPPSSAICRASSREIVAVAADITTDAGRASLLAACPEPDILVLNNRGPKPGILADQTAENFEEALTLHFRTPLALLMAVLPGMKERGWGRIVCITSAMVTAPEEVQVASASARAPRRRH